ncbi:hypothetical protein ACFWAA_12495 [Streptomyces sp. NPDC059922]|uniref:hypothetical protein n=1 Tax=Streptomyces sp. NPDC059922 TaxID=3347005 RepID=UPI003652137E
MTDPSAGLVADLPDYAAGGGPAAQRPVVHGDAAGRIGYRDLFGALFPRVRAAVAVTVRRAVQRPQMEGNVSTFQSAWVNNRLSPLNIH